MRLHLSARPPFSFRAVADSHGWRQLAPFSGDADALGYVMRLGTGRVIDLHMGEVPASGSAREGVGVAIECADGLSRDEQAEIAASVAWMLGLEQDLSLFYAAAAGEPKLAQAAETAQGRLLRSATLFEDVVKTILTTNTAWSGTIRMVQALVDLFGEPLDGDPARRAFPAPASIAASDEEMLRKAARLGYRAPSVLALARAVAADELDLEGLKAVHWPTPELRKRLLAIKGVGPYAAANLLMLLGHYDAIPIDSWALTSVSKEWHDGAPIGPAEVEAAFARWGQFRGLAYWFWAWREA